MAGRTPGGSHAQRGKRGTPPLLTPLPWRAQGEVELAVEIPVDDTQPAWGLRGQTLKVAVQLSDTVRTLKDKLTVRAAVLTSAGLILHVR